MKTGSILTIDVHYHDGFVKAYRLRGWMYAVVIKMCGNVPAIVGRRVDGEKMIRLVDIGLHDIGILD